MLVLVIVKQIISDKSPRSSFFPKPKRAGESRDWRPRDSAGFGKMPKVGGDKDVPVRLRDGRGDGRPESGGVGSKESLLVSLNRVKILFSRLRRFVPCTHCTQHYSSTCCAIVVVADHRQGEN